MVRVVGVGVCLLGLALSAAAVDAVAAAMTATVEQRVAAATAAASGASECREGQPFYWEIGDAGGRLASGSVGRKAPTAQTEMKIASASKWLFGAYVVEKRNGQLQPDDVKALTMRTGYTHLRYRTCVKHGERRQAQLTVRQCFEEGGVVRADNNAFFYNGGHFQWWAVQNGLGDMNNAALAQEMKRYLGADLVLQFSSPQPAGGAISTPASYGLFLQRVLGGQLKIGALLGAEAVCASPKACPQQAHDSPLPENVRWHYSLGHWVEDDPDNGDGSFSSAGFLGFYPWIDADKRWYGLVAREKGSLRGQVAMQSAQCGKAIRRAWLGGGR